MIEVLVALVVVGVLLYILSLIPMDATVKRIIYILVLLVVFLWVLQLFGLWSGPVLRR